MTVFFINGKLFQSLSQKLLHYDEDDKSFLGQFCFQIKWKYKQSFSLNRLNFI